MWRGALFGVLLLLGACRSGSVGNVKMINDKKPVEIKYCNRDTTALRDVSVYLLSNSEEKVVGAKIKLEIKAPSGKFRIDTLEMESGFIKKQMFSGKTERIERIYHDALFGEEGEYSFIMTPLSEAPDHLMAGIIIK